MSAAFDLDPVATALIAVALVASVVLATLFGRRKRLALIVLQPIAAGLLLAALSLRDAPAPSRLIVLTAGADARAISAELRGMTVALPGFDTSKPVPAGDQHAAAASAPRRGSTGIERMPDLATALRRFVADELMVFGEGLAAHDREAVGSRALRFEPAPASASPAIESLEMPSDVRAGAWWRVQGRASNADGTKAVLLDPAGKPLAEHLLDASGRFGLEAIARAPGRAVFELQLRRGDDVLQSLPVPVVARSAAPLRVLLLAAAPSPELKYLRRWALDAGVELEARIGLAPGLAQRRGQASLSAGELAELDLLIVDERSWAQLAALQPALREAVAAGLGLMVRVTGPVPERVAQEWTAWGIDAPTSGKPLELRLPTAPQVALHAWPAGATSQGAATLLASNQGTVLAEWRALGRGRVGSWRLTDSHRLTTRGDRERHATLWSDAVSVLARPRGTVVQLPERAVVGERAVVCGLGADGAIGTPTQSITLTLVDGCAAFWPREAGWHRVDGADDAASAEFYVFEPRDIAAVLTAERREATLALAKPAPGKHAADALPPNVERWRALLLAAWLAVMTVSCWMERRSKAGD